MSHVAVMDPTEHRLLQAYVTDHSEEAFRQLVERHLDMVYHTALRRTGDPSLSEDVSQVVFTVLARKARRLKAGFGLGGWLHRTTLYEASRAVRAERRRSAKMKEFAERQSESSHEQNWENTLPVIDDAIESLSNKDREAIILRFFEEQSFRAIGKALGKSEDASQKQVSRALEKLSLVLRRQGFAASITGLGSLLATESARAAPTALSHSISHGALSAVPSITSTTLITNTLLTMTYAKTKTAVLIAVLAAVPMGLQWKKIQTLETRLETAIPQLEYAAQEQRVKQLTSELATTKKSLTQLQEENTARLARAAAEPEKKGSPFANMADMFNDPAMQGVLRQQMDAQVRTMFGDLLASLDLPAAELAELEALLTDKLMIGATKGMKTMDQSLSSDERKALADELKEELEAFDDEIREQYGNEIADKVKLYEESTSERQELGSFKSALALKGLEIPFETEEELMAVMYEERMAFKFTHNLNDSNDASVLANLNEETFAAMETDWAQLHERIDDRVQSILEGEALEAFRENQANFRKVLVSTIKMSQQMLGGQKMK